MNLTKNPLPRDSVGKQKPSFFEIPRFQSAFIYKYENSNMEKSVTEWITRDVQQWEIVVSLFHFAERHRTSIRSEWDNGLDNFIKFKFYFLTNHFFSFFFLSEKWLCWSWVLTNPEKLQLRKDWQVNRLIRSFQRSDSRWWISGKKVVEFLYTTSEVDRKFEIFGTDITPM